VASEGEVSEELDLDAIKRRTANLEELDRVCRATVLDVTDLCREVQHLRGETEALREALESITRIGIRSRGDIQYQDYTGGGQADCQEIACKVLEVSDVQPSGS